MHLLCSGNYWRTWCKDLCQISLSPLWKWKTNNFLLCERVRLCTQLVKTLNHALSVEASAATFAMHSLFLQSCGQNSDAKLSLSPPFETSMKKKKQKKIFLTRPPQKHEKPWKRKGNLSIKSMNVSGRRGRE